MNENGNNNNQNNDYNIYNSMNNDAFNVFNQNFQNNAPAQPAQPAGQPVQPTQPVQVEPVAPQPDPNLVTVNDYKEPKEPFSFKNLLKKKIEEEEKTFNIDDITNFKDEKETKIDPEEMKEKKKKIKDIIILVVAIIALIIVGIIAYNVFSNYLLPSQNIVDSNTVNKNIKSNTVVASKDVIKYNCDYPLDDTFYNLPAKEYLIWESYQGTSSYSFIDDKLDLMEEQIDITYNVMEDEINKSVIKYCNSYNKVLDQYQFICTFKDNHLIITNTFYLNKVDKKIGNVLGEYKLKYNNHSILGDVITNNTSCTKVK